MVIWGRTFRDDGDLGLNNYWNCLLRVLALSASIVNVLPFAFMDDMPSSAYFECFNKECNFIVLALVDSFICPFRYTVHWMFVF